MAGLNLAMVERRMKYSSRFWLYAPLALFLTLAGWAMAHWWSVAAAFDKKLTALNGHQALPGITLSYTSKTISGFPFNIDVVFTGFKIAGIGAHGPFAWSSERFALHALTYGRTQEIYEAAGRQMLAWSDGDGKPHHIDFLPASLHASAIADSKGLARFDLDIKNAAGKDSDGEPFAASRAQFHMRRDPGADALDVMISADEAHSTKGSIRTFSAYTTLTQGTAWARLLAGTQSWPDANAAWQKAGGIARSEKRTITPAMGIAPVIDPVLTSLY